MAGLTLLGILLEPAGPAQRPGQAAIAAHCVTRSGPAPDQRRTGGTARVRRHQRPPGDGKTSLTLALGLSYAACAPDPVIDCDLVGAGLTARMNVNVPEGVLEAIANRSLRRVRARNDEPTRHPPVGSRRVAPRPAPFPGRSGG